MSMVILRKASLSKASPTERQLTQMAKVIPILSIARETVSHRAIKMIRILTTIIPTMSSMIDNMRIPLKDSRGR